jgi:hypothetical protein
MLKNNTISCNNETFIENTFHEISLIRHEEDGYINATKLCEKGGKKLFNLTNTKRWAEIIEKMKQNVLHGITCNMIYDLFEGFPHNLQGTYIHPKLVHFVAEYVSIDYAFKVAEIMDLIDEKNHLLNKTLEDTICEMKKENEEIKKELDEWKQGYEEESMKNIIMGKEISNLRTRAVPDNCQYKFVYLIYPKKESDYCYTISLVRRQKENLTESHLDIINNKTYWIYEDSLPVSTTLNRKILTKVLHQIPNYSKDSFTRVDIPKEHKERFIGLMKHQLFLEKYK